MSGIESLAILGIACNVMQVISFAHEVTSICKSIFTTGSPDPSLMKTLQYLTDALNELDTLKNTAPNNPDANEKDLFEIAEEVKTVAAKLEATVDGISGKASTGSYKAAIFGGFRARLNKERLGKLEKSLEAYQKSLETRILLRLSKRTDIILNQQQKDFDKLDDKLKNFIEALGRGQTSLHQLISNESQLVKAHVTSEVSQLGDTLKVSVVAESSKIQNKVFESLKEATASQITHEQHEKLLKSLKYKTMNNRRNQIPKSYNKTYEWIFGHRPIASELSGPESSSNDLAESNNNPEKPWDEFSDWLQSPEQKLFWVCGKAGSGKSTLMKFLVLDRRTQTSLDHANTGVLILSHFIWAAGELIDRNIKGILCSLMHQLLQDNKILSALLIQHFPASKLKSSYFDWSNEELDEVLFHCLSLSFSKPIGVFLDGLDEIDPSDGFFQLLDLVNKFQSINHLKICVSSRPEHVLEQYLSNFPLLKVQDLTESDITIYTTEFLEPYVKSKGKEFNEFITALCSKSNGVFLWVSLALESLREGLTNHDSLEELWQRLETLPDDLYQLYQQMWNRLNRSQFIYRKDAAIFFNYALEYTQMEDRIDNQFRVVENLGASLHLVVFYFPKLADAIIRDKTAVLPEELAKQYQEVTLRLKIRCAGLLELSNNKVTFIHQSAKEFLENTLEGQKILQQDSRSLEERQFDMIKATLALINFSFAFHDLVSIDGPKSFVASYFIELVYSRVINGQLSKSRAIELMFLGKSVFEPGGVRDIIEEDIIAKYMILPRNSFIGLAAGLGFSEFIVAAVEQLEAIAPLGTISPLYKNHLISSALPQYILQPLREAGNWEAIPWLLKRGYDLNIPIYGIDDFPTDSYCSSKRSLMAIIINIALHEHPHNHIKILAILNQLIQRQPPLSDRIILIFEGLPSEDFSIKTQWQFSQRYCGCSLHNAIIILEVNISYLIYMYLIFVSQIINSRAREEISVITHAISSIPKFAVILAYKFPGNAENESGDSSSSLMADRTVFRTSTKEDSDHALENLNLLIPEENPYAGLQRIPEFSKRLREIDERSSDLTFGELEKDLVRRGFLIHKDDVKDWPPAPSDDYTNGSSALVS